MGIRFIQGDDTVEVAGVEALGEETRPSLRFVRRSRGLHVDPKPELDFRSRDTATNAPVLQRRLMQNDLHILWRYPHRAEV